MVGAINPNVSTPISTQQSRARDSAYMLNPGEPFPPEAPLPSGVPSGVPTAVPKGIDQKQGLAPGAIAGIAIGALSFIVLAAVLLYLWGRTKALSEEVERKESTVTRRLSPTSSSSANMAHSTTSPLDSRQNANSGFGGFGVYQPRYTTSRSMVSSRDVDYKPSTPQLMNHPAFASPYEQNTPNPAMFELGNAGHVANGYFPVDHNNQAAYQQRTVSPPIPSSYGYGQQSTVSPPVPGYGYGQQKTVSPPLNAAPPYGWHVNSGREPAEIEGTMVRGEEKKVNEEEEKGRKKDVRWEEVGGKEGGGESDVRAYQGES
jgi:hypothetical protein